MTNTREQKLAEFNAGAWKQLRLERGADEPADGWRSFTSEAEHPDLFSTYRRLSKPTQVVNLVPPLARGGKP